MFGKILECIIKKLNWAGALIKRQLGRPSDVTLWGIIGIAEAIVFRGGGYSLVCGVPISCTRQCSAMLALFSTRG